VEERRNKTSKKSLDLLFISKIRKRLGVPVENEFSDIRYEVVPFFDFILLKSAPFTASAAAAL
jgi:hypothetical protein